MAIDFPSGPTLGQIFTVSGKSWIWDGTSWKAYGASLSPTILKVDAGNSRVGINNQSPAYALDVTGVADATAFIQNAADYLSPYNGFRNAIINGDFRIWQRGTTFNSIAANTYVADRWKLGTKDAGMTLNVTQQSFTAGSAPVAGYEGQYYLRLATTAYSTGNTYYLGQYIEDVRSFAGQTVTLSYWARVASGTLTPTRVYLYQDFGSGGSGGVDNIGAASPTYTTTWTRYTQTISVPSIATKTVGTSSALALFWQITPNANATFELWGVQVERGSYATPFEQRPIQTELALCQRYFQRSTSYGMAGADDDYVVNGIGFDFPQMRISPIVSNISSVAAGHHTTSPTVYLSNNQSIHFEWSGAAYRSVGFRATVTYDLSAEY